MNSWGGQGDFGHWSVDIPRPLNTLDGSFRRGGLPPGRRLRLFGIAIQLGGMNMIMRKHSVHGAMALGAVALAGLCAFVPTPVTVSDNFNNNSVNQNLWEIASFGGKNVAEVNQRLQFSANGATGLLSFAGLLVEPWGANWRRDFEIEFDYKLNLANVAGNRAVFLGVGLALEGDWPTSFTGLGAGLLRNNDGLFLGWFKFENGVQVDFDGIPIAQVSGQVNVEWDRSDD
jgi:hypothetical protein